MTRDYNKPRRDDARPFSRPQPPYRQGDERSPRPARPHLNRETVDRAWESGAPTQHADYRTRSNNGQPPRNSWRNNQQSEHSPAQNGRKPFGNRQDGNRRFDRTSNEGYQDNRSRSFGTDRNQMGTRRTDEYRGNTGGPNRYGARPNPGQGGTGGTGRPYGQRPPFREHDEERNNRPSRNFDGDNRPPRSFDRDNRPPRNFDRDNRPPRDFDRDSRPPHSFDRNDRPARGFDRDNRPPRDFDRDNRPPRQGERNNRSAYSAPQRDTENPRWQSRPSVQRERYSREQSSGDSPQEHFEGDYERFNTSQPQEHEQRSSTERPFQRRPFQGRPSQERPFQRRAMPDSPLSQPEEKEEHHVTRLPDGRVLKGPRPVQRRNAQFWTDITEEAESLVEQAEIDTPSVADTDGEQHEELNQVEAQPATPLQIAPASDEQAPSVQRKPRTRSASAVIREKKPRTKAASSPAKPRSNGPKPSRRGFKWPTP